MVDFQIHFITILNKSHHTLPTTHLQTGQHPLLLFMSFIIISLLNLSIEKKNAHLILGKNDD